MSEPTTGTPASTPTGRWLQDQLHDDATAYYALTSRRFGIGGLVVKVQDAIPKIEAEAVDAFLASPEFERRLNRVLFQHIKVAQFPGTCSWEILAIIAALRKP